jgi:UDP-galactopyranose mutase
MDFNGLKYIVVGSGFFGSVIAERIAEVLGERVVILEKRNHSGGNSYSANDPDTGIECHTYGSHIFHTRSEQVWSYIRRFAHFNNYRHKVLTMHQGKVFQMPINLETINSFYGTTYNPHEAEAFICKEIQLEQHTSPHNLEEKAISLIGRPLYEAFIRGYTLKQWDTDPKLLPAEIITRLPMRFSYKDDYFNDPWQGIPLDGYQAIFRKLICHKNIDLILNTDYFDVREQIPTTCRVIYTGPIDRFFDYKFGNLGWRSLRFEQEVIPVGDYQGTSVMNYAEETVPFTRIHEFRHYHEERPYPTNRTVIFREYACAPKDGDELFYPINTSKDRELLKLYQNEASVRQHSVLFGGRLGSYAYLDMDRAIESALEAFDSKFNTKRNM